MRRIVIVTCVMVLVALGAGTLALRWSQRGPARPSLGKAIDRFHASSTVPFVAGALRPSAGVYAFNGSGRESLTFMNTHQSQGPTEPGTITSLAGNCSSFEIVFNSFHSQRWTRCVRNGKLVETGGSVDQKFDFVAFKQSEHSDTVCNPPMLLLDPGAAPGSRSTVHCTGHSRTTKTNIAQDGTITFVGRETVDVSGTPVAAWHDREELRVTGDQTGTVQIDLWFAVANGLPLRDVHSTSVVSPAPAPINHVTYTEHGQWTLRSLAPHR